MLSSLLKTENLQSVYLNKLCLAFTLFTSSSEKNLNSLNVSVKRQIKL